MGFSFGNMFDAGVDFFGGGQGGGAALGNLVNIGTGLYNAFRDHDSASANAMSSMLGAAVNPNDPRFRNLAALFAEKAKADAMQGIRQYVTQAQRARARGGPNIVNPERRDEFVSNSISQAFMDAGNRGREMAARTLSGTAGQYQPLIANDIIGDQRRSRYIGAIGEGIGDLFRNWNPSGSSYSPIEYAAKADVNAPGYSNIF